MAKSRRFIDIFDIDEQENRVNFSPSLFFRLRIFNDAIKSGRVTFADTGINSDYFDSFASAAAEEAIHYSKELKKLSDKNKCSGKDHNACAICSIGYLDYNLLDYLEGTIKSACDNQITTWSQLGLRDKDHFDEVILLIKEMITDTANDYFFSVASDNYRHTLLEDWLPYREEIKDGDEDAINLYEGDDSVNDNDYLAKRLRQLVPEEFMDEETTDSLKNLADLTPDDLYMKVLDIKKYGQINQLDIMPEDKIRLECDLIDCEHKNTVNTLTRYEVSAIAECEKS